MIVSPARTRPFQDRARNVFFNEKRRIDVLFSRARERVVILGATNEVRQFSSN